MGDFVGDLDPRDQGGGDLTLPGAHALWAVHAGCSVKRDSSTASAHSVLNFRDAAPPSPRGVLANATPRRFPLRLITRELVLGHVTFVLQQLFQISLERSLCFNHCIERFLYCGRQIIGMDVLPLQFFPCHCLAPAWSDEKGTLIRA